MHITMPAIPGAKITFGYDDSVELIPVPGQVDSAELQRELDSLRQSYSAQSDQLYEARTKVERLEREARENKDTEFVAIVRKYPRQLEEIARLEVRYLVTSNCMIDAIKKIRIITGLDLKAAKDLAVSVADKYGVKTDDAN